MADGENTTEPKIAEDKPKKKRSIIRTFFKLIGWLVLIFILLAVAGYFLVKSGRLSLMQLVSTFGPGSGEISITNISDNNISADLTALDKETGSSFDDLTLQPYDIAGFGGVMPGPYILELSPGGNCNLVIERSDRYQFVAVPEGVIVTLKDYEPQNSEDIDMAKSSLCIK